MFVRLFRLADRHDGRSRDFILRQLAESVLTGLLARMAVDDVLSTGPQRRALAPLSKLPAPPHL